MINCCSSKVRFMHRDKSGHLLRSRCLLNDEMCQDALRPGTGRRRSYQIDRDVKTRIQDVPPGFQKIFKLGSRVLVKLNRSRISALLTMEMVNVPRVNVGNGSFFFTFNQ